ncbi:MAG: glycerol kinase GlpK [Candidatus Asgardarchaeia archaeon]
MDGYILSIDEGTTRAKAIIWDNSSNIVSMAQYEIKQIYPKPGWVEHNPDNIWEIQLKAIKESIERAKIEPREINAIGITNQRETTILWDKNTGRPIYNAIVWQCRRTTDIIEWINREGYAEIFKKKTGLIPDPYFSGPKIKWILDNIPEAREKAKKGDILFGTVDSYLLWKLTGGRAHYIDFTNASRTMLFNIHKLDWDDELLDILDIPRDILPIPRYSSEVFGITQKDLLGVEIPITGMIGDQQASLVGHAGFYFGNIKCTYGTGNFILINTGDSIIESYHGLLTTIAYGFKKDVRYALEGSIFITGGAVRWLKDCLQIISSPEETETLAKSVESSGGVYFVPAFTGLGTPHWDEYARGLIIGISLETRREHIVRAMLEAVAFLTKDVIDIIELELSKEIEDLRVDGGMVKNDFLMQFQADILGKPVVRPSITEVSALGAAYMAGLEIGYWKSPEEIAKNWRVDKVFEPKMPMDVRERLYSGWKKAVKRALLWAKE